MTPKKLAEFVIRKDLLNLQAKANEGKPLSAAEFARLQAIAAPSTATAPNETAPASTSPNYVSTLAALADALGVTRQRLNYWRKLDGAPKPAADGRHNVAAWRTFAASRNLAAGSTDEGDEGDEAGDGGSTATSTKDAIDVAKLRKITAEADDRELRVRERRGDMVSLAEVSEFHRVLAARVRQWLLNKAENELPPLLQGADAPEIRERLRDMVRDLFALLHELKNV